MRASRSSLVTIALGVGVVLVSAVKALDVGRTAFALFVATAILVELFEESDRERMREPVQPDRLRLASAVHVAALIVLGPWAGALVAAAGVFTAGLFRGYALRGLAFTTSTYAIAACAGGIAFERAGGDVGSLRLLDDLIALVALGLAYLTARALLLEVVRARENFGVAPGIELGREGVAVALPLRRDNSALVGFFVVTAPKLPPRHVELALLDSLDETGLALAARPQLDGSRSQSAEPLETAADPRDFVLARLDER